MKLNVSGNTYDIIIERKSTTRNTYIRVKPDLSILVTTNKFTPIKTITDLIEENYEKIVKMIEVQQKKNENNDGFFYLGKHYDIIYVDTLDISFGENKVFLGRNFDIDKWYKKQAKDIFKTPSFICTTNINRFSSSSNCGKYYIYYYLHTCKRYS